MSRPASVAVFCASSTPRESRWLDAARELGVLLAREGVTLVYGGGARGIMCAVAEGCHESGGHVIGVLPEIFNRPDVRLKTVHSELEIVPTMHDRKERMYSLAEAFIILPGGIGTLEEFFEIYTWKQIGLHRKNIALYNIDGFYTPLLSYLDKLVAEGLLSETVRNSLIVEDDAHNLIAALSAECVAMPDKLKE